MGGTALVVVIGVVAAKYQGWCREHTTGRECQRCGRGLGCAYSVCACVCACVDVGGGAEEEVNSAAGVLPGILKAETLWAHMHRPRPPNLPALASCWCTLEPVGKLDGSCELG